LRTRKLTGCVTHNVINRLAKHSFLRIFGLAAGAAVVSGAAVLVTASAAGYNLPFLTSSSSPAPSASTASLDKQARTAVCNDFVSHFSADLGKSQSAVSAAFQKAIGETLADQVKNGKLTQAQADKIKQRLAGQAPCAIAGNLKAPGAGLGAYRPALLTAAASALGITDQTLKTDLAQGMTLAQIAAAQKPALTEADFRSRLIAKLTPALDAAVANKQLTADQEAKIIKHLQTGPIPFWNKPMHAGKAPRPAAATTPNP
jgi:hypothetical protein